jgi:hypothetical protein
MTLAIPLGLLVVVLAFWGLQQWRLERRRAGAVSGGSKPKDG